MSENPGICLRCRFYDDKPPLAGDLPETYGLCNWEPDLSRLPAVKLLGYDLLYANAKLSSRMIPKRALKERGDLWSECDTFDAVVSTPKEAK